MQRLGHSLNKATFSLMKIYGKSMAQCLGTEPESAGCWVYCSITFKVVPIRIFVMYSNWVQWAAAQWKELLWKFIITVGKARMHVLPTSWNIISDSAGARARARILFTEASSAVFHTWIYTDIHSRKWTIVIQRFPAPRLRKKSGFSNLHISKPLAMKRGEETGSLNQIYLWATSCGV